VTEVSDGVFVYMPSRTEPEPPPFDGPPEFNDPEWTGFLCMARWGCSYRYALDNLADPMHGSFLHADSFTLAYGAKQDLMKLEEVPEGIFIARVGQQGQNLDRTQFVTAEGSLHCRLDIPYPPSAGPGGPFRIIGYVTPVDAEVCLVFFWRLRRVSGLAREAWRFLYRAALEDHHWRVLEQDREILEGMEPDARDHELLYQHDIGVGRLRRILAQRARQQIEAEDTAAAPAATTA
jgi:phenylpropionate dioxygenase-like ring-hydroxylating dioxygenase large terminal subunit